MFADRNHVKRWGNVFLFSFALVVFLLGTASVRADLLGLYEFEGNASDSSAYGNDGTVFEATLTTGLNGLGQAYLFDGINDKITAPVDISPASAPRATIGAWVYWNGALGVARDEIISVDDGGYDRAITVDSRNVGAETGTASYAAFTGTQGVLPGAAASPSDGWVFVAAVYDETSTTLYVNDTAVSRASTPAGTSQTSLTIGCHPTVSEPFMGTIDNVFVFSNSLDSTQINTIRTGGVSGIMQVQTELQAIENRRVNYQAVVQAESSLVSYYTFDGDTATSVQDVAGSHDATSVSGTLGFNEGIFANGQGAQFTGSNQVNFGNVPDFDFLDGSGTIEGWVRYQGPITGSNRGWLGDRSTTGSRYSLHWISTLDSVAMYSSGSGAFYNGGSPLEDGQWVHLVYVFDSGTTTAYINGQLSASFPTAALGPTGLPFQIGNTNPTVSSPEAWMGGVDEVAIYADALSAETLTQHWLTATGREIGQTWDFETGDLTGWSVVPCAIGDNLVFSTVGNMPTPKPATNYGTGNNTIEGDHFIRTWDGVVLGTGDGHTGIVESDSFVVGTGGQIDLLVGGGNHPFTGDPDAPAADITAVTLERQVAPNDWEMVFSATGPNGNYLQSIHWDLASLEGETVRLRIYDTATSSWGHIGVDDIRYTTLAPVPEPAGLALILLGLAGLVFVARRRR